MRVAIVGGRDFNDYAKMKEAIAAIDGEITSIVSGGAEGADDLAYKYAKENGISITVHFPKWREYDEATGRMEYNPAAGFMRNALIVKDAEYVLAFWDGKSKGTKNTIGLTKKAKKRLTIIGY